jgi:hypothetical protein
VRSIHSTRSNVRHLVAGELHDRPTLDPAVPADRVDRVAEACFRVIGEIVLPFSFAAVGGHPVGLAHDVDDVGLGCRAAALGSIFDACLNVTSGGGAAHEGERAE